MIPPTIRVNTNRTTRKVIRKVVRLNEEGPPSARNGSIGDVAVVVRRSVVADDQIPTS